MVRKIGRNLLSIAVFGKQSEHAIAPFRLQRQSIRAKKQAISQQ